MNNLIRYSTSFPISRIYVRIISLTTTILVALLLSHSTPVSAESWGEMLKGMAQDIAKDLVDEGKHKLTNEDPDQQSANPDDQAKTEMPAITAAPASGNNLGPQQLKRVQLNLQKLGYDPGPADGVMGPKTTQAISQFEKDRDLPVTGQPSPAVLMYLQTAVSQTSKSGQKDEMYELAQMDTATGAFTGSFATAKKPWECDAAYVNCVAMKNSSNVCVKQKELCEERIKSVSPTPAPSLTPDQIEQEARQVATNCQNQSVMNKLYDCACVANEYRAYRPLHRGGHRFSHGNVDNGFYDTDWATKCYQPNGAYNYAYNTCMSSYPMSPRKAKNKSAAEIEAVCQCQGHEFMTLQSHESGVESIQIQNVRAEANRRCE
ncbi:peptidoglycan-binding domain-containing protein [Methylophaga sp. OBS4]|uniref:peptidoglycan-binding domain-containing protein n=1 Tax=Methylophaga sp. OBS4 TaxID=2991935 RepID=UPI0022595CE4|nr:peptidoglycan-binding domain-containing protein [Methylophaga sp. OBS4]MCX4186618.1 peptidoglycan-binding protein [Methylophaga sp. OBS4]